MSLDFSRFTEYPLWFKAVGTVGILLIVFFLIGLAFVNPAKSALNAAAAWPAYERFVVQENLRIESYNRGTILQLAFNIHDGQLRHPRLQNKSEIMTRQEKANNDYNQWIQDNVRAETDFDAAIVGLRANFPASVEFDALLAAASRRYRPHIDTPPPLDAETAQSWATEQSNRYNATLETDIKRLLEALSTYLRHQIEQHS